LPTLRLRSACGCRRSTGPSSEAWDERQPLTPPPAPLPRPAGSC
jgi:hypothetical protein